MACAGIVLITARLGFGFPLIATVFDFGELTHDGSLLSLIPLACIHGGRIGCEINMILKDRAMGSEMHLTSEREGYRSDTPAETPIHWPRYCGVVGG